MIRYFKTAEKELISLDKAEPNCWIAVSPPFDRNDLTAISEKHNIPFDFLTDSIDIDERSRYEREDDGTKLIVVNTPYINEDPKESEGIYITVPIGIIITDDHLITITGFENNLIDRFIQNRVKNFNSHDEKMFILKILEQNVFEFLSCLKKLNLKRNLIERELYDSSRNEELKQLLRIEKSLVYFVNTLSSNELLKMKMKRTDFLDIKGLEEHEDLFEDIIIDNSQALEMANVHTNILSGTMEAYASIVSNNLNVFIQRLTIATIVLMVPTLVASFYGMNVQVPFRDSKYAFFVIVLTSIILAVLLIWIFRRKKLF
jgi:magnesium transporter